MRGLGRLIRPFRSRVALRVFLLCVLCSLVPTLVIGVAVYTSIAAAGKEAARAQLQDAAKRYGVVLNERLKDAEIALAGIARRKLAEQWAELSHGESTRLTRVTLTPIKENIDTKLSTPHHEAGAGYIHDESLQFVRHKGRPAPQITLVAAGPDGKGMLASAVIDPDFLWQADLAATVGVELCVWAEGQRLSCSGETIGAEEYISEQWQLFLQSHYGARDWTVVATQPRYFSEAGLATLRATFPLLAGAALLVALLIGSYEVRRTHGPIAELLAAFRSMARGQFTQVTLSKRRDEYARIGTAFNQLSHTLRRQFRLLTSFERMDKAILARPAVGELMQAMLPRLPQMLACEQVALSLISASGSTKLFVRNVEGSVKTFDCKDEPNVRARLQECWPLLHWQESPVRLADTVRGHVWCGREVGKDTSHGLGRQIKGVARRFAVALRNEEREQLLVRQAYYDELTGLPNRRLLQDRVQQALREAEATGTTSAFIYLDVDRFKTLNDSLGHRAGDDLLVQLGKRLSSCVLTTDTVARLGGDEFAILLRTSNAADTVHIAERILAAVREPINAEGVTISPQASIGIAMYPQDGADFDALLRNSDAAMYRGKAAGGGQAVFFEEEMNSQAMRRLRLESALRRAFVAGGLELHFQPKVDLANGELIGAEALMRWTDPELGVVSPSEFVPMAEESGLIRELGQVALVQAIAFCRRCMDDGVAIGHIAVNVSMLQLRSDDLPYQLQQMLAAQHVPPAMLQIEVTESAIMQDAQRVSLVLQRIRDLGVRIAVDDFGTGYSSLAVLQQLPLDVIKLDRAFVTPLCESPRSLELVRAMLAVANALGLRTVAEGVETPAQAMLLAKHGCNYAQGWLYGKAVSASQFRQLARRGIMPASGQPWIMTG